MSAFTCDGEVYADQQLREGPEQIAYSQPAYLKLSLACGSGNHGQPTTDPDEWANTNKYIVDWVHIYQKDGQSLWSTDMLHGDFKKNTLIAAGDCDYRLNGNINI